MLVYSQIVEEGRPYSQKKLTPFLIVWYYLNYRMVSLYMDPIIRPVDGKEHCTLLIYINNW